jgi:hypothetical protein
MSLDLSEPFEVSDEWMQEIARRCHEIDEGRADLIPGDTVLREASRVIVEAVLPIEDRGSERTSLMSKPANFQ